MASRRFSRLRNGPTREGWYYLALCGFVVCGAVVRDINLLLILSGLLLTPLLANGFLARRSLKTVTVRRKLPSAVAVGEKLQVRIELSAVGRSDSQWFTMQDELRRVDAELRPCGPRILTPPLVALGQHGTASMSYSGQALPRGRYRFLATRVSTSHPWGLSRRSRRLSSQADLFVYPALGQFTADWYAQRRELGYVAQRSQPRQGPGGDFYGLRDWRTGDSRRLIHWRSSARHGALMVRQTEQPRSPDLVVLVDLWQPENSDEAADRAVEVALSFAATALHDACRHGNCRVVLGVVGRETAVLQGGASQRLFQESLELLATAVADERDHQAALAELAGQNALPGVPLWVISTRPALPAASSVKSLWRSISVGGPELEQMFVAASNSVSSVRSIVS